VQVSQWIEKKKSPIDHPHHARHFDGIHARNVALQTLPPGHPAGPFISERDQAFEDLRRAFLDGIAVAAEAEDMFAIGTAFAHEFLGERILVSMSCPSLPFFSISLSSFLFFILNFFLSFLLVQGDKKKGGNCDH
jgi:hypothetical protein